MNEQIRHKKLLAHLSTKGILSVNEIITLLQISPATARRDIVKLNEQGKLKKIRNGVESINSIETDMPIQINSLEEKQRIAQAAAKLCQDGDSVLLTCGSTMRLLGKELCNRHVQIITNYLPLANQLIENDHENVVIMGGQYHKNQAVTLSLNAADESFAANIMFTSGKGLTSEGLYKTDMIIAHSEQRISKRAEKLVVLVDSSKLGKAVGMLFTELENIDLLITGKDADTNVINELKQKGLNIIFA